VIIVDNRLPFIICQPEVTRYSGIVLVDLAIAIEPIIIFAACNFNPSNHFHRLDTCFVRPGMVFGYNLYSYGTRLYVFGCDHGLFQQICDKLVSIEQP